MTVYTLGMDLIALAVLVLCAIYYSKKGFLVGVLSLFGTLAALIVAGVAANNLAPVAFEQLFRPGLEEKMVEVIAQQGVTSLSALLYEVLDFLPKAAIDTAVESLGGTLDLAAPDIAKSVVDQVLRPLITPLLMAIIFFVTFALAKLVVRLLKTVLGGVGRIPGIHTVNSALGAVIGVCIGFLYIFIAICIIWAYDALNPHQALGQTYFAGSFLWQIMHGVNFFA